LQEIVNISIFINIYIGCQVVVHLAGVFMFRVFSLADEKNAIGRGYTPLLSGLLLFISQ
jgi:hypothetical protein